MLLKSKKFLALALAVTALSIGSLAATGDAFAKGGNKGGHGFHGGHGKNWHGGHGHKWHGHKWRGYGYGYNAYPSYSNYGYDCFFVRKYGRLVKICPGY
jgi:hypothetical protein